MSDQHQVFLSYSRKDKEIMLRIYNDLRAEGLEVWMDNELKVGTPEWERDIENAIKNTSGVVVLLSPDSYASEWVGREIAFADEFDKRIFPVLVRGDVKTSVPIRLVKHNRVDTQKDYAVAMHKLINDVCHYLGVESITQQREREAVTHQPNNNKKRIAPQQERRLIKEETEREWRSEHLIDDITDISMNVPETKVPSTGVSVIGELFEFLFHRTLKSNIKLMALLVSGFTWLPLFIPLLAHSLNLAPASPINDLFEWLVTLGIGTCWFLLTRVESINETDWGLVSMLLLVTMIVSIVVIFNGLTVAHFNTQELAVFDGLFRLASLSALNLSNYFHLYTKKDGNRMKGISVGVIIFMVIGMSANLSWLNDGSATVLSLFGWFVIIAFIALLMWFFIDGFLVKKGVFIALLSLCLLSNCSLVWLYLLGGWRVLAGA